MRVTHVLFILTTLLLPVQSFSRSVQNQGMLAELFAQGNSEYRQGNYASAEQAYSRMVNAGVDSGPVFYNLGNACFKQKKLGQAVYYWEEARQRMPSDDDARQNLELAELMIVDRIQEREDPLPSRIVSALTHLFTIEQETRLVLGLFIAANLLFSVYLLARSSRNTYRALVGSMIMGSLFIVFACSLAWNIYEQDYRKKAVVIEQRVDVLSGPGAGNIAVFTIHEGLRVRIHESAGGWYQISLPNGWNGWLPQNSVRVL